MKRIIITTILAVLLVVSLAFTTGCDNQEFTVTYSASEGGYIDGNLEQTVTFGQAGTTVIAVPFEGYQFVKWSDNNLLETRTDIFVREDITRIAIFEPIQKTLRYYDYSMDSASKFTLNYQDDFNSVSLTVPTRGGSIFEGWYSDYLCTEQVANSEGKLVIGKEIFDIETENLFAKWTNTARYEYKILLIFVTEINATLTNDKGVTVEVNYKMSEAERNICKMTISKIFSYLNYCLSGVANVVVDSYFTTVPLSSESIKGKGGKAHSIMANDIQEVYGIIEDYQSIITTFSLNDFDHQLHFSAGMATIKFGCVYLDSGLLDLIVNDEPIERLFDFTYWRWENFFETYIHELTHTIEVRTSSYDYHEILSYYYKNFGVINDLITTRLYLLNQALINGEPVGISNEFWKGGKAYVTYVSLDEDEGIIQGNNPFQLVSIGEDAQTVTAIGRGDYQFARWSDGITTATRTDTDIQSDLHVYAIFEKIS